MRTTYLAPAEKNMAIPSFLKGESITRLLQGGALGAVATIILGFNFGGWTLGSTATKNADDQTEMAIVSSLAPICVDKFHTSPESEANLTAFINEATYKRAEFIEDGGWAILPGSDEATAGVAKGCALLITESQKEKT